MHQRNELMNETIENEEFDLTILFEEGDVVISALNPLMCHTGSNQDNASRQWSRFCGCARSSGVPWGY